MNATDLSKLTQPARMQEEYERATSAAIARCIAFAIILITIGLTAWYGSAVYGNPILSSQDEHPAVSNGPSDAYFTAQYAKQAPQLDVYVEAF